MSMDLQNTIDTALIPAVDLDAAAHTEAESPTTTAVATTTDAALVGLLAVAESIQTPKRGIEVADEIMAAFENTAKSVEALAADRVAGALALQQEAITLATTIRQSGRLLCIRIEDETTKGSQVMQVMMGARKIIAGAPTDLGSGS